jgi:hypothetical protein
MKKWMPWIMCLSWIALPIILGAQGPTLPALPSGAQVRTDNRFFDISPRVVPANRESTITIVPRFDHVRIKPECQYELTYFPVEQIAVKSGWQPKVKEPLTPVNGRLRITKFFEAEQEHVLVLEEIKPDKKRAVFCVAHVFSLEPDLLSLRPFKGEFHLHSNNSDGVESPAYVAGASRRAGLDFMALTDHRLYEPSMQAAEAFTRAPVDLRIFPGEEVHPPGNPIHIVSFGAKSGITELYRDPENEKKYRAEVAKLQAELGALPPGVDPYQYASCVWVSARIRERGGLGMFAHAYWYTDNKFAAPGPIRDLLLQRRVFDVMELISGFDAAELDIMDTNALQVARYYEEIAKGNRIAIAGISDAHGIEKSEPFGRFYTICFAPSSEFGALKSSIQEFRSVAVEALKGERPRPFGPFRLVKFSHFLLREILPQHDELCLEEGLQMIRYAAGDTDAVARLRSYQGQVARLYDHFWAH